MALEIIEKEIKSALEKGSDEITRGLLGQNEIHDVTIRSSNAIAGFKNGLTAILNGLEIDKLITAEEKRTLESVNQPLQWRNAINKAFRDLGTDPNVTAEFDHELLTLQQLYNVGKSSRKGVYILKGSTPDNFTFRLYTKNYVEGSIGVVTFCTHYREAVWKRWKEQNLNADKLMSKFSMKQVLPSTTDPSKRGATIRGTLGTYTPFAHDNKTTVGRYRLEQMIDNLAGTDDFPTEASGAAATLQTYGMQVDIFENIKKSIGVTFEEREVPMPDGGTKIVRLISGEIKPQKKEPSDWSKIKPKVLDELELFLEKNKKVLKHFDPAQALDALGSPSAKESLSTKAAEKIVNNLVTKNPRAKLIKAKKAKKASPKKIRVGLGGASGVATTRRKVNLMAGASGKIAAKKATKEKGNDRALELHKLKQRINRRLPAEVRRNMGRPALRNQTGTFSNSVRLETLRDAQKTIVGEYTYQLSPYETFENTGQRRWPSGYNPKPLITKSIRNLAQGIVEDKFTLRRV